ncbi:hypothetical protein SAMN06297129_0157 [Pseudooceanicola antarcticus]|uniref:DUF721 domain-containing protein n=1 Tax=Pseudooceanicola antarcticus TaxID=1247613 RepID=A0A285HKV3_9RHOB|nr:DciA family protein [Pseudooceanicola antarcticus]PJE27870.1 DUF721 domain-containing protein [Pseudooceanicola antarcticus]SNY36352.1 hypothetical protein SAMN06297129_0157 [Pseudooceanicola antarcticus]
MARRATSTYGFKRTYGLLETRIRKAGEARGFAVSRLLTHWEEIAGSDIAAMARPVEVKYGRGGNMGATLVVLTTGAHAPVLEMEKERLKDRVNAVYGYSAISKVRITQTAPTGFSDGQVSFTRKPAPKAPPAPDPETCARARDVADGVQDGSLREALEKLGQNIMKTRT